MSRRVLLKRTRGVGGLRSPDGASILVLYETLNPEKNRKIINNVCFETISVHTVLVSGLN